MEEQKRGEKESQGRVELFQRSKEDLKGDEEGRWRKQRGGHSFVFMPIGMLLALLGVLTVGVQTTLEHTEGHQVEASTPKHQNPGPWESAVLVLNTTAKGGISGLLLGVAAVTIVWVAETLSSSKGLVATVTPIPPMSLLIGMGAGAVEGVGGVAELSGPGVLWEAVSGGVRGAGMGARVAVMGGVVIGSAMCSLAAMAVKNIMTGAELRVAPLMTVSVVVGAARMALSLAPESMATGAFFGAVMGASPDLRVLGALGTVVVGAFVGVRCLGGVRTNLGEGAQLIPRLVGGLAGAGGTLMLVVFFGFPLRLLPALVSAPVGASIAFLIWRVGQFVCQILAEVVEKLFGAISVNTHYSHAER